VPTVAQLDPRLPGLPGSKQSILHSADVELSDVDADHDRSWQRTHLPGTGVSSPWHRRPRHPPARPVRGRAGA